MNPRKITHLIALTVAVLIAALVGANHGAVPALWALGVGTVGVNFLAQGMAVQTGRACILIADLAKIDVGNGGELITEISGNYPELGLIDADTIDGGELSLAVRTDLPTVGFSNLGGGVLPSAGGYITRLFQTGNLKHLLKVPKDVLRNKSAETQAKYLTGEQQGAVEAALRTTSRQFYYGITNDDKGFIGLIAQSSTDSTHVVDAGGSTAKSSVFFVCDGMNKLQWLFGHNRLIQFEDWYDQTVADDADATKSLEAKIAWMYFNPGVKLANRNALVRIKNIGTTVGTNALTWDMMMDGKQKMAELGMTPTRILMSYRSQRQLRDLSKTPENPNPPMPKEFEGIPIEPTHSISNAETI